MLYIIEKKPLQIYTSMIVVNLFYCTILQCEGGSRPVTVREKAEKMFLDVLTRPNLTRTVVAVCQPFLSPCEQTTVLGKAQRETSE